MEYIKQNENKTDKSNGQAKCIENEITLLFKKVPKGDDQKAFKHITGIKEGIALFKQSKQNIPQILRQQSAQNANSFVILNQFNFFYTYGMREVEMNVNVDEALFVIEKVRHLTESTYVLRFSRNGL